MTKKDYQLIATALRTAKDDLMDDFDEEVEIKAVEYAICKICAHLSIALKGDNKRFNNTKFYEAIHNDKE